MEALRTSSGEKYTIKMSRVGDLETFREDSTGRTTEFKYLHSTRLLRSKLDLGGDAATFYDYDDNGRLVGVVAPTGKAVSMTYLFGLQTTSEVNVNDGFYQVRGPS